MKKEKEEIKNQKTEQFGKNTDALMATSDFCVKVCFCYILNYMYVYTFQ